MQHEAHPLKHAQMTHIHATLGSRV